MSSAESRDSAGGTSKRRVQEQIQKIIEKCNGLCP